MCGRYVLHTEIDKIAEYYDIDLIEGFDYEYRYNIAPSEPVLSLVNDGKRNKLGYLRWGLIPSWAKEKKIGYKMINARAETLGEKPAFKTLISRRRCVIIADSFYEWKKENGGKQPYCIKLESGKLISFAGLWDRWDHDGEIIHSCTIITTSPNDLMRKIHDRMPVILSKNDASIWLDRTIQDKTKLMSLLQPYQGEMQAYPISSLVNSPKNNSPELLQSI